MTSVDTGWITDERPHPTKMRLAEEGFHAPLDLVDGAARVYDPIVRGEAGEDLYGCNDFNTPTALAALFEWVREANRRGDGVGDADLREMLGVLGPRRADAAGKPPATSPAIDPQAADAARRSASRPAPSATSPAADRDPRRAAGAAAGRSATGPQGPELIPAAQA